MTVWRPGHSKKMRGHHYSVNGMRFFNFYAALRYSAKVPHAFAEYVFPKFHTDAYESVKIKALLDKPRQYYIREKLSWIFRHHDTQRLHYSGGTDSHTILTVAQRMGFKFTDSLTACSSVRMDQYVDEEYVPALEYLKNNPDCVDNAEIIYPTVEDFEKLWRDPETFYKHHGAYFTFRPIYPQITMRGRREKDCEITGHSKPKMVRKNGHYYWIGLNNNDEYMGFKNEVSFFGDGFIPELAVKEAYLAKKFWQEVVPCRDETKLEGICFNDIPVDKRSAFNSFLGREPAFNDTIATGTILGKAYGLNVKNNRSMSEIISLGRQDIADMWNKTREKIIKDLKDIPDGIKLISQKCAFDNYEKITMIPMRINRIGFCYRLDTDRLTPVDHVELFNGS